MRVGGRRGPHRDPEVHQRILDATLTLIGEQGPSRVTVDEIAAHAGVGKQTIYRWWPSKSALAIDALEAAFEASSPFPQTGTAYEDIQL